ncbi:MAG: transposase, partial [Clostridiales bacterium]|nr:transposase [Clostridiales bacterium]
RFGKRIIAEKLDSIKEEFGVKITYVNPAYTSQTCFECGYVDKNNRTMQATFRCRHCGNKLHADVNASRNILVRSSDRIGSIYVSKKLVLQLLVERFTNKLERRLRRNSTAKDLLLSNPYFKDYRERFKGVLPA